MRVFILFLSLVGAASAQQLFMPQNGNYPREAESILIASCRAVGERFLIPLPSPRVELRLGEKSNGVESKENFSVIHLQHWNKTLFKRAALHVCLRAAEFDLVPALEPKIPDY